MRIKGREREREREVTMVSWVKGSCVLEECLAWGFGGLIVMFN